MKSSSKKGWLNSYASALQQKKHGGIIEDDNGYWNPANHGKPVKINSNKITMQGVDQPLLGVSDTGHQQIMHPGQDYIFDGSSVIEYPLMKRGGVTWLNEYQNGGLSIINKAAEKLTDQANYLKKIQGIKNRISNAETFHKDNPYTAVNDTTGAIGKYQFIPLYNPSIVDNYPDLSEFKNNPQAQEAYMDTKIPEYWTTAYKLKEKYPDLTKNYTADDLAILTHFQGANALEKRLVNNTMDKSTNKNPSPNSYLKRTYGDYKKQQGGWLSNYNI